MRPLVVVLFASVLGLSGCARDPVVFSVHNASAHVGMLADTIGSRPVGTPANARARSYIVDQLRLFGYDVRVQETDGRRPEAGRTARVSNVIGVLQGNRDEAIGLVSHYDSSPAAPGAADDGFGVAVSLEAARVLAGRAQRNWSLLVLVTDGEEAGLLGAAALMTDRDVLRRLHAYINIEAAGSAAPVMLFESGPGNSWLVEPWARRAPHPRGASFGTEIYRRLPNDTDFSILERHDIPGLNFAAIGDSHPYHTARDAPDRLDTGALRDTGENVVAVVSALDAIDITQRADAIPTFFDVGGRAALTYGPRSALALAAIALTSSVIAWVRVTAAAFRLAGIGRWLLTFIWTIAGALIVTASMIGTTWALRVAREVYHPWYARPQRLFFLLLAVGVAVAWGVVRLGQFLPARAHGLRHPLMTWSVALPFWIVMASYSLKLAPGAAYLWIVPLATAGVLLSLLPPANIAATRLASVVVLGVTATLWLPHTLDLLRFIAAVFGRLPVITPVFVYAALMVGAAIMLVPPFVALLAGTRPLLHPAIITVVLLISIVVGAGAAYVAPAYTYEQPLRREVRALQSAQAATALWEVGSVEPGLDLGPGAPAGWQLVSAAPPGGVRWGALPHPFVFRADGPGLGEAPVAIAAFTTQPVADGAEMALTVVPKQPGLWVSFVLPERITPARANLPGLRRLGRWTATYIAPPTEGVTFRASFNGVSPDALRDTHVGVTTFGFPGGSGWQRLPEWLPQERAVWTASATWQVPATTIAPVPPLR